MDKPEQVFGVVPGTSRTTGQPIAFLSITEDVEDEFGFITRKRGFIPINPNTADKALAAAEDHKVKFMLGSENRQQPGLYGVIKLTEAGTPAVATGAPATLEHQA